MQNCIEGITKGKLPVNGKHIHTLLKEPLQADNIVQTDNFIHIFRGIAYSFFVAFALNYIKSRFTTLKRVKCKQKGSHTISI